MTRRRELLVIGGIMAAAIAVPPILRRRAPEFEFSPLQGFPGFRRLSGQSSASGPAFMVGLNGAADTANSPDWAANPCEALFGEPRWSSDPLPIAVFSDYFCPYCAELELRLVRLERTGAPVRLIWHELPLLGPRSVWAAQVALAAKVQGKHDVVHRDLMQRVLRPGLAGLSDLAERHDLDLSRLQTDASGPVVASLIQNGLDLGQALGIPGTPGTMVGRTLVVGNLDTATLEHMIRKEQDEPFTGCV